MPKVTQLQVAEWDFAVIVWQEKRMENGLGALPC